MAVTGSFRQQCPSCEAMVLVKDPKQVGKKIDCPNCKFRFVVEDPKAKEDVEEAVETTVDEEEAKPKAKSNTAITTKKPTQPAIPGPAGKKKPVKKKIDDDDDEAPRKKKGNMVFILGIGLSAAALLILGVGGYFLFFSGSEGTGYIGRGTRPQATRQATQPTTKPEGAVETKLAEVTNLLPGDSQSVLNVNMKDLVGGSLGRAAFDTPGAFKQRYFDQKIGLALKKIDRVVLAQSLGKSWLFAVVRTNEPIDLEEFKTNANLQAPADGPYKNQEYFLTPPSDWLDRAWQVLGGSAAASGKPRQFALRVVDPQTVVLTDSETLMKAFLDEKGQPKLRTKAGAKGPGGQAVTNHYLTVSPELKKLLDQLETKPLLASWAMEMEPIKDNLILGVTAQLKAFGLPIDDRILAGLNSLQTIGVGVQTKEGTVLSLGLEYKQRESATDTQRTIQDKVDELIKSKALTLLNTGALIQVDGKAVTSFPEPAPKPAPQLPKLTVKTQVNDQTLLVSADIVLSQESQSLRLQEFFAPRMIVLRGNLDMVAGTPRLHDLAGALTALVQKEQKFPRGTFARPLEKERRGRPHPPDDCVSWMVELLPFLDMGELRKQVQTDKSWRDPENALEGVVLVPALIDPTSPGLTWWAQVPSVPRRMFGTTQFVGVAGVGLDAAEYDFSDAAVASKLGVFGYERETETSRIKDGAANTIALLQVPPLFKRPWLAGGGATVQGVPDKESIKPFVCVEYDMGGKRVPGTMAIMADGSVRFIPATISDEAFKGLCTIAGGEKVDLDKETVLVPPPGKAVLKTKD